MDDTRHSGFTLIELLITLSIVALLAGLAVPAMGRFVDGNRLRGAAETLIQELRQARNHAITHQQSVSFRLANTMAETWCYGWNTEPHCNCLLDRSLPGACSTGQVGSSDFPRVQLTLKTDTIPLTLQFSALRGTAGGNSIRLGNRAGEVKIIISPLGRVRACATRGSVYPSC